MVGLMVIVKTSFFVTLYVLQIHFPLQEPVPDGPTIVPPGPTIRPTIRPPGPPGLPGVINYFINFSQILFYF